MKKLIKKFKDHVYIQIFKRFQSKNGDSQELLAALTVNALRELSEWQRYRLALDMGLRVDIEFRKMLVREFNRSMDQGITKEVREFLDE